MAGPPRNDFNYIDTVMRHIDAVARAGVRSRFAGVPAYVECSVREDATDEYVFLLNHSAERRASVPLDRAGTDLLTGRAVAGEVELGAAVVRIPRTGKGTG